MDLRALRIVELSHHGGRRLGVYVTDEVRLVAMGGAKAMRTGTGYWGRSGFWAGL